MALRLFGNPQLTANGVPLRLSSNRAFHILARIALLRGGSIDRRALIESIWPDLDTEAAFAALRRELYRIEIAWRDAGNESPLMLRDKRRLGFDPKAVLDIDVLRFEAFCENGNLIEAARRYAGDFLVSSDDPEIDRERQRFAIRIADVFERLIAQARREGRYADAIDYAMRLQANDPYHEQTVRTLMQLRSDAGDRGAALATYQTFETLISTELRAKPLPATVALFRKLADVEAGAVGRRSIPPEHASLIGRERDVARIVALLDTQRLVTLTGPPGIGKSRLATRIAWLRESDFADGAFFVDLTNAAKPGDVERIVLETLSGGTDDASKTPEAFLERRTALVIVDNCEHVIEECSLVLGRILAASPGSKLLATSRRPIHLAAEAELRLPPLALPAEGMNGSDAVLVPAVRLFLERAERVRPFAGDPKSVDSAVSICALLDGVPLALELAASRLRLTTLAELESLLLAREPLLTTAYRGEARPTREAPYAWSYRLLTAGAQRAFRRLAVFAGGFTLEAARAMCEDFGALEAIDAFAELVEHSMVVPVDTFDGTSRHKLLFSAYEFAVQMLAEAREADDAKARHARFYIDVAASLARDLVGLGRERAYARLRAESRNILAALEESILNALDVEGGLRTCIALARYWTDAFMNREGLALIEAALHRIPPSAELAPSALSIASVLARQSGDSTRAIEYAKSACEKFKLAGNELSESRALTSLGNAYTIVGDLELALAAGLDALLLARKLRSDEAEMYALCMVAQVNLSNGDVSEARSNFARALDLSISCNSIREGLISLNNLAVCALLEGDLEGAEEYAASALDRGRSMILPENVAWALSVLATVAWNRDNVRSALSFSEEVVTAARMTNARILEIRLLEDIARYLAARGEASAGAKLIGAGDAARTHFDQPLQPIEEAPRERFFAASIAQLGTNGFEAARSIGTTWSLEDAVVKAFAYARAFAGGDVLSPVPRAMSNA